MPWRFFRRWGFMMRIRKALDTIRLLVLSTCVVPLTAHGGEKSDVERPSASTERPLEVRVSRLVVGLGGDTLKARNDAERELLEIGPSALDHLPPPDEAGSASIKEAVRRIRIELERRKATASLEPARVTLTGRRTLADVLAQFRRQSGNAAAVDLPAEALEKTIEIDFDEAPFWRSLDEVVERSGLRYAAGATGISLQPRGDAPPVRPIVDYPAAFRIEATKATLRPLLGVDDKKLLRVSARLEAEPRLRPLFIHFAARNVRIRSDEGVEYRPFTKAAKYELPLSEGTGMDLTFDVVVPAADVPKTVHVEGTVSVYAAAGTEEFVFGDLSAKNVSRRRGGVTVRLKEVKFVAAKDGARNAEVEMSVVYDAGGPAFESHRTWIYFNGTWLSGKDGRRIEKDTGLNATNQTDGGITVEYGFSGLKDEPSAYRFHYAAPTLLIDKPLPFRLRHVPVDAPKE